jgi:hypothetical protein
VLLKLFETVNYAKIWTVVDWSNVTVEGVWRPSHWTNLRWRQRLLSAGACRQCPVGIDVGRLVQCRRRSRLAAVTLDQSRLETVASAVCPGPVDSVRSPSTWADWSSVVTIPDLKTALYRRRSRLAAVTLDQSRLETVASAVCPGPVDSVRSPSTWADWSSVVTIPDLKTALFAAEVACLQATLVV